MMESDMKSAYRCNICRLVFNTKGEALAHHYKTHKMFTR